MRVKIKLEDTVLAREDAGQGQFLPSEVESSYVISSDFASESLRPFRLLTMLSFQDEMRRLRYCEENVIKVRLSIVQNPWTKGGTEYKIWI